MDKMHVSVGGFEFRWLGILGQGEEVFLGVEKPTEVT